MVAGAAAGPGCAHLTLYRGVNNFEEHHIVGRCDSRAAGRRTVILRLNNLVSFGIDRDITCQFGDHILEAQVPCVKLVFFRDLLPRYPFQGEGNTLSSAAISGHLLHPLNFLTGK